MGLKSKIIKGGAFLAVANIFSQISAIAVNIVLARLLLPEDFGLIALATTYIGFIALLTSVGFGSAIIYKQSSTEVELSTLYWANFILAILSYLVIAGTAPLASEFYNEPELKNIVWISAITVLLSPVFTIHYKIKERDLEFKLLSKITIISTTIAAIAGITAAYKGFGVYSLVIQLITFTIVRLVLILYSSNWKPRLLFRLGKVKDMIWYSVKYHASTSVLYMERNIDYLILGRIFSATTLGYYAFSYNIMYTPVKRISYIFSDILFPSFSALKDSPEKILNGYLQSMRLIAIISFPIMALLSFNAEWIIQAVFGPKWNGAVPIVQILCFAGALQSISQFGGVIFSSIGKPEVGLYVSVVRTFLVVAAIIGGSFYGILAVAYCLLLAKALSLLLVTKVISYFIPLSLLDFASYLKGPVINVAILGLIQFLIIEYEVFITPPIKLVSMVIISILITLLFHLKTLRELFEAVFRQRNVEAT